MTSHELLLELNKLAQTLGVEVRRESLSKRGPSGGLVKLRGHYVMLLNESSSVPEQVGVLEEGIAHFDVTRLGLSPELERRLHHARLRLDPTKRKRYLPHPGLSRARTR